MDMKISCILIGFAVLDDAELYRWATENIWSNIFLSDLSNKFRNDFHSYSSMKLAIRNEGIVLPIKQASYKNC